MKRIVITFLSILLYHISIAQLDFKAKDYHFFNQVSIGKMNSHSTHSSSWLDLGEDSTTKGFLLPRVWDTAAIYSPTKGLLIYYMPTHSIYYYDSTAWVKLVTSSGATSISTLLAASGINNIDNADYQQTWTWNSLTSNTGLYLQSSSTRAMSSSQTLFGINTYGVNSNSSQTTYGAAIINGHSGTSSTNIAGYFSANNGSNNYALIVPPSGGRVGLGTSTPTEALDINGNLKFSGALMPNNLPGGTGQYLQTQGPGLPPIWTTVSILPPPLQSVTTIDSFTSHSIIFANSGLIFTNPGGIGGGGGLVNFIWAAPQSGGTLSLNDTIPNISGTIAMTSQLGKQIDTLPTVTAIASWSKIGYAMIYVTDTLRGGLFIAYSGSFSSDNGMCFTDLASRKWMRVIKNSDPINICWYPNVIPTTTITGDCRPGFLAAIAAASNTLIMNIARVHVPGSVSTKTYYMSDSVSINVPLYLTGDGANSNLRFAPNKNGLIFNYVTTRGSEISNLTITAYASNDSTKSGLILRDISYCFNVTVNEFGGNGFYLNNSIPYGNSSNSSFRNCSATLNGLEGFYVKGADANNMSFNGCSAVSNGGLGIYDMCFLGNHYYNFHAASNGSPQVGLQKGLVTYGGHCWAATKDSLVGVTPVAGIYWIDLGTSWATGYPYIHAYDASKVYYMVGAWNIDGMNDILLGGTGQNQTGDLWGCYSEADQAPAYIGNRVMAISGTNGATYRNAPAFLQANENSFYIQNRWWSGNPGSSGYHAYMDTLGFNSFYNTTGMTIGYDNGMKAMEIRPTSNSVGISLFKMLGNGATAASLGRTNLPYNTLALPAGILFGTTASRTTYTKFDFSPTKPSSSGNDLGDYFQQVYVNYLSDKPEVVGYKKIETTASGTQQFNSIIAYSEYSFQTTNSTPFLVFADYYLTNGIQYNVDIFASYASDSSLWSEKRFVLISGNTSASRKTQVKSNQTVTTPFMDANLVGATFNPLTGTDYNVYWYATGLTSKTINWKIQIRRSIL